MAGFKFSINVEPQDIPRLDDAHKRDCADALEASVNSTLKYTLIMSGAVLALFAAYSLFGFTWMLRMGYMLPQVSGFVPLTAMVIFLFEFVSGTMKGWALALQTFFHVVLIFAAATRVPTLVIVPFAICGAILHFKLITLLPWYRMISVQPGYPEFTSLPERKKTPGEEKETSGEQTSSEEKQSAAEEDQSAAEEQTSAEEKQSPSGKKEEDST